VIGVIVRAGSKYGRVMMMRSESTVIIVLTTGREVIYSKKSGVGPAENRSKPKCSYIVDMITLEVR
jgi:hypothetical protein